MSNYDRASEIKAFDETKAGVKGYVDAGITKIPNFFVHPSSLLKDNSILEPNSRPKIPLIDLQDMEQRREEIVYEMLSASETFGFFQLVNHGIPEAVLDEMLIGVQRFHEEPSEVKKQYYTRDPDRKVRFGSNFDLYTAPAANWRDTLFCIMKPDPPAQELPLACRDITIQYSALIQKLGSTLFELLSEALGLNRSHLNGMECADGLIVVCHYYPSCPEPQLTFGTSKHSDPTFLTILLQDQVGGLQVLHKDQWVDVSPSPRALVINIGDLLQLITNDKLKSVEHRVLATKVGPRISVASFFRPTIFSPSKSYGPIKELVFEDHPSVYKEIQVGDYFTYYMSKGLGGQSALNNFKL